MGEIWNRLIYGSNLAKLRRQEEDRLLCQIASLSDKTTENLSQEELLQLSECQNKLDEFYRQKAQGVDQEGSGWKKVSKLFLFFLFRKIQT